MNSEVPVAAVWHERYRAEEAHRFFRTLVVERMEAVLRSRRKRSRITRAG
jgi:hypothetical protein